jgi:AcrR family transcriptional regulator
MNNESLLPLPLTPHSPRNRERQKLETRRRIIDAACRVFARDGILASTTAAVAREAGVSQGSVFVHFGSQEGLLAATIQDFGDSLSRRLHELIDAGGGTREVLAAHLKGIGEREDFYSRLVAETPLLPEGARLCLLLIQSTICFHLSPAVEADARAGKIKEMPLALLFNTWVGLIHYYLANRGLFSPGAPVVDRRGNELLDHFMFLIAKGGRR